MKQEVEYWCDFFKPKDFGNRTFRECEKRYEVIEKCFPREFSDMWHPLFGDSPLVRGLVRDSDLGEVTRFLGVYEIVKLRHDFDLNTMVKVITIRMAIVDLEPGSEVNACIVLMLYVSNYCSTLMKKGIDYKDASQIAYERSMKCFQEK